MLAKFMAAAVPIATTLFKYIYREAWNCNVYISKLKVLRKPEKIKMIRTAVPRIRVKPLCQSSIFSVFACTRKH